MTALLLKKLLQGIESADPTDVKNLRDCTAALKELSALEKSFTPSGDEGAQTGVIILPEVRKE